MSDSRPEVQTQREIFAIWNTAITYLFILLLSVLYVRIPRTTDQSLVLSNAPSYKISMPPEFCLQIEAKTRVISGLLIRSE